MAAVQYWKLTYEVQVTTDSHRRSSAHLDLIRGFAAVTVFISHARGMFFVDYGEVTAPNIALKSLYLLTGFGHQAVIIFFVLSGYFITSAILRKWPHWSWSDYLADRLVRLYLVLLPGLLLTAAMDRVGYTWGHPDIYEGRLPGNLIPYRVVDRSETSTFIINVGFLQTVLAPPFGSNSPLWSLCNEFWYYLAFPCLLLGISGHRPRWQRVAYLCAVVGFAWLVGWHISLYFPIWLIGAAVHLCPPMFRSESVIRKAAILVAGIALLVVLFGSRIWANLPGWDFAIGGIFAVWMYIMLHNDRKETGGLFRWISRGLAGCSFTLYVVHFPALVMVYSFVAGSSRWQPDFASLAILSVVAVSVFGFAIAMASITEAHTRYVRQRFRSARHVGAG